MAKLFNIPESNLEEWRDIEGFEGLYKVSNFGRVKGLDRVTSDGKHIKSKILTLTGTLYLNASLWKNNVEHNILVHRAVAKAFIPNPDNLPEINHKDKDIHNNHVSNLEWVTASVNHQHRVDSKKQSAHRRSVRCLETNEIFSSISAAGRSVDADTTQIVESIQAKRCCKGMTFAYEDDLPEDIQAYLEQAHAKYQNFHKRPNMPNCRKVQIVETGQTFDSIAETARFLQCDTATVSNRIKAKKPFNGITLKFVE